MPKNSIGALSSLNTFLYLPPKPNPQNLTPVITVAYLSPREVRDSDIPIDYLSMKPNKSLLVLGSSGGSKLVMLG